MIFFRIRLILDVLKKLLDNTQQILNNQVKIMATGTSAAQALADLQAAVADLQTKVQTLSDTQATLDNAVDALLAQLQGESIDPKAVEDVVAQLQAVSGRISDVTTAASTETGKLTPSNG